MTTSVLWTQLELPDISSSQLSPTARQLSQLLSWDVPIPAVVVVPSEVIRAVADFNHWSDQSQKILQRYHLQDKTDHRLALHDLQQSFTFWQFPPEFCQLIQIAYEVVLHEGFVDITIEDHRHRVSHYNCQGSSNILDSIKQLWQRWVYFDKNPAHSVALPQNIILQWQPQPTVSGRVLTKHPHTAQKNVYVVQAVKGVLPPKQTEIGQWFAIDVRSNTVINRHLGSQPHTFARQLDELTTEPLTSQLTHPLLSDLQLQHLVQIVQKIKHHHLSPLVVRWFLHNQQLYITTVKPLPEDSESVPALPAVPNWRPVIHGQPITAGVIEGTTRVILDATDLALFAPGEIAVTKSITHQHLPLIQRAAALICEEPIRDALLLSWITQHRLPCIINAHRATTTLKTGQHILLEANQGVVILKPTTPIQPHFRTITQVLASAGNPHNLQQYQNLAHDGFFFKSDYTLLETGIHPIHVLRTSHRAAYERNLAQATSTFLDLKPGNFWYRPTITTSADLRSLKFAESYTETEPNPYLGQWGTTRIVHNPVVFDFEMQVINKVAQNHQRPLEVVLPHVRTPAELIIALKHIENQSWPNLKFWAQLGTPAALNHAEQLWAQAIHGFVIDLASLNALWYGIDPEQPNLVTQYPLDLAMIEQTLQKIATVVKKTRSNILNNNPALPVIVDLPILNDHVLALVVKLGLQGVMCKPHLVTATKQRIMDLEKDLILYA